jgi:HEPN domain
MPHDPALVAETESWLAKAASDLAAGAHDLRAEPPFVAEVVFHAQQAVEKTLAPAHRQRWCLRSERVRPRAVATLR